MFRLTFWPYISYGPVGSRMKNNWLPPSQCNKEQRLPVPLVSRTSFYSQLASYPEGKKASTHSVYTHGMLDYLSKPNISGLMKIEVQCGMSLVSKNHAEDNYYCSECIVHYGKMLPECLTTPAKFHRVAWLLLDLALPLLLHVLLHYPFLLTK